MELGFPACSVDRFVADPESGMTLPNPAIVPNFTHLVPPEGHDWIYPFTTLPHYHSQNAGPWCAAPRAMHYRRAMHHACIWQITSIFTGACAQGCSCAAVSDGQWGFVAGTSTRRCATEGARCPQSRRRTLCMCMTTGEALHCACPATLHAWHVLRLDGSASKRHACWIRLAVYCVPVCNLHWESSACLVERLACT